ncbi:PAN2-PAN3 deadenylation complex subunit Pan3 [Acropora cervicornis]|uniref:PAN2-PAN3 deadenylation complex subunit Pan3 n=1 Tax=Acropora cervicornis TaxID=6130 RepID=A0AAD9V6M8_ACRCE|nr:PAN2-PAN3 deadenylation complex subunit Pan3 [Acropora cervicornis]
MNLSNSGTAYRPTRTLPCRYYSANGYCFYGDQCQFVHAKPSENRAAIEKNSSTNSTFHRSSSTPTFSPNAIHTVALGAKGLRGGSAFKNNAPGPNAMPDNYVNNMSQLSVSTAKLPPGSLGGHTAPLSPSKKAFISSLAPGGPNQALPQNSLHSQAQVPGPQQMESIGGTTYFYMQQAQQQPAVLFPSYQAYISEPAHLAHLQSNQTRNNAFSMSTQLRQALIHQHTLSMAQLDPENQTFRLVNAKSMILVDQWKKISHSNLVSLREVFTTKAFALVFAYDYHPGAETLLMRHFSGPDSTLPVSPDGTLLFPSNPRSGGVPNRHRPGHRSPMPERLIWSYIIQLSSALRTVHAAGLACRVIDPSKVLLIGNSRLRINGCGIFDVLSFDASNSPNAMIPHFQQEDLTSLGKLVLALACYSLQAVQREHIQQYLLSSPIPAHMKSVNDIMPMIGARFYTQLDAAQVKCDVLEGELAKTGDRYLLKLFRDYLFHQVTDIGGPWIDLAHIVACLNKLDAGSAEKVCLVSRDEQSVLVVSYRDLKNCFDGAFSEILSASLT